MDTTLCPKAISSSRFCALFIFLLALSGCGGGTSGSGSGSSNNDGSGGTDDADSLDVDVSFDGSTVILEWEEEDGAEYNVVVSSDSNCDIANHTECADSEKFVGVSSPFTIDDSVGSNRFYAFLEAIDHDGRTRIAELGAFIFTVQFAFNDTGIDWCANGSTNFSDGDATQKRQNCESVAGNSPGQDAMRPDSRDVRAREGELQKVGTGAAGFDYTKLNADGDDLEAIASDWVCVRDNHTGLIWEVKLDGVGVGLRGREHHFTWYDSIYEGVDGRSAGVKDGGDCVGSRCDTEGYVEAVNAEGLCGASDWRMPTIDELHSISHLGSSNPAIDADFFPNTASSRFWSSSLNAGNPHSAWYTRFERGTDGGWAMENHGRVRVVRVAP